MEAIKCPNCGSEKVKELTEEKYACLACDNIFLVHNLSKEFRQTDAHITDMHEDINEKLDNLSKNVNSVTINSNAQASRAKEILIEAQDNFDMRKILRGLMPDLKNIQALNRIHVSDMKECIKLY